jgi:hypothetical protein
MVKGFIPALIMVTIRKRLESERIGTGQHVSVTTNRHAIIHELLEVVTSIRLARSYERGTRN